jgi:hypothetical protein
VSSSRSDSTVPGAARDRGWTNHLPEPRNLWIRHRPRRWPPCTTPFVDLANGRVAVDSWTSWDPSTSGAMHVTGLDDVVYLPVAGAELDEVRQRLARESVAAGLPLVIQRTTGVVEAAGWERDLAERGEAVLVAVDLCRHLLFQEPDDALDSLEGCVAAVPLLPGLLDVSRFAALAEALVTRGVRAVHLAAASASPATRRALGAHLSSERDYAALFHAPPLDERALCRIAVEVGLRVSVPRPLPGAPPRLRTRRLLAGLLAEAGDLWTRIDPTGREAAPFFRAARFIDESPHDLEGLARDGNLRVLEWLERGPREVVEEALRAGSGSLVAKLRERWLEGGGVVSP